MGDVDLDALASDLGFVLKSEQKKAVESLLNGRDIFCVLPTGFGESLIFQLFVLEKNRASNSPNAFSRTPDNYLYLSAQKHYGRADNIE